MQTEATCTEKAVYYYRCATGSCTARGTNTYKYGSKAEHNYTKKTTTSTYLKSGKTCTQKAVYYYCCTGCTAKGTNTYEYGELLSHDYGTWITTISPTCTTPGAKKRNCTVCNIENTDIISEKGHSYGDWTTTTAETCTTTGTKKKACTRTGCSYSETKTINALGHSYTTERVTRYIGFVDIGTKYTCSRCSHSYTDWSTW